MCAWNCRGGTGNVAAAGRGLLYTFAPRSPKLHFPADFRQRENAILPPLPVSRILQNLRCVYIHTIRLPCGRKSCQPRRRKLHIARFRAKRESSFIPLLLLSPRNLRLRGDPKRQPPFPPTAEQRYNTLDFARQSRVPTGASRPYWKPAPKGPAAPLDTPPFSRRLGPIPQKQRN